MNNVEILKKVNKVGVGTIHFPHGWLKFNYDFSGICPTIDSGIGMQHTLLIEVFMNPISFQSKQMMIVAMRGRNPDNPTDRTKGIYLEQRLEVNLNGLCNCLTRVSKDNMVLEIYGNGEDKASN